jgi:hypothetical protein
LSRRRHRLDLVAFVALIAAVLTQASAAAPLASAVSPARGAVTSARPVFLAAVVRGDLPLEIQVATSPAVTAIGFRRNVALCIPTAAGRGRVRCSLSAPLRNGTYYWTLVYQRNTRCQIVGGRRYCFPEPHLTTPTPFTVRKVPAP